jgi:hypothetical protein
LRNRPLWDAIRAHPLPADAAGASFAEQLAREHKISQTTATRGIEEYRRFIYLSALNEGRSVPSKAVDAVWHLHLTHTRDYWNKFVPDALGGRAVHHEPGAPQGHGGDFAATLRRYEAEFGEAPPKGIWKRRNRVGGWIGLVVTSGFTAAWCSAALASGAPVFAIAGLAIGGLAIVTTLGHAMPSLGIEVGFDMWSDSEGGACGDCGGGCGD